jgi:hypothetical protein
VQAFGKGFGEPVGQGLGHDAGIVVVISLECGGEIVRAEPCGHRKRSNVIRYARVARRDEVRKTQVRTAGRLFLLLAQKPQYHADMSSVLVNVHLDVVADGIRRKNADGGTRPQ